MVMERIKEWNANVWWVCNKTGLEKGEVARWLQFQNTNFMRRHQRIRVREIETLLNALGIRCVLESDRLVLIKMPLSEVTLPVKVWEYTPKVEEQKAKLLKQNKTQP